MYAHTQIHPQMSSKYEARECTKLTPTSAHIHIRIFMRLRLRIYAREQANRCMHPPVFSRIASLRSNSMRRSSISRSSADEPVKPYMKCSNKNHNSEHNTQAMPKVFRIIPPMLRTNGGRSSHAERWLLGTAELKLSVHLP